MTPDETALYQQLGYQPLAVPHLAAGDSGDPRPDEIPPLDAAGIEALRRAVETDPGAVLEQARGLWDARLTEDTLRQALVEAHDYLTAPREAASFLRAAEAQRAAAALPASFRFPLMTDEIPLRPSDKQFETVADAARWVLFTGPYLISSALSRKPRFRWHDDPAYPGAFVYPMPDNINGGPVQIALFSDFGTGLYHSRYIARQLEEARYPYAVHLGDVYYAGRTSEFVRRFQEPLARILPNTSLFTLSGNHEMYSSGIPFFNYLSDRHESFQNQPQQGSYFALRSSRFQIVGLDTQYFQRHRCSEPGLLGWLEWVLGEGRREGLLNILLTSDEPYEYGEEAPTALFAKDLGELAQRRLIDLWFWGNTHYCALFHRSERYPFLGSCIGHGGYPYSRKHRGLYEPAKLLFLETQARFPAWTGVRQDRGNNGYCFLELATDGSCGVRYVDWMGNTRCTATLEPVAGGGAPSVQVRTFP